VDRLRAPRLALFAALSLALHVASFAALRRAATSPPTFDEGVTTVAGDTLDVEPAESAAADDGDREGAGDPESASSPSPAAAATVPRGRAAATTPAPGSVATAKVTVFGAVGVRYATDLTTTFTRAFPQAASADPAWGAAPFGSAGTADVTLWLDEEGHLGATSIGGAPSAALRRGIERTLALLASRPFTARSAESRLRLRARIGRNDVHDGLHGDVFALSGGSFAGDTGTAFFALPPENGGAGRRVDVELRLLP
jgi:hypothetical protein